MTTDEEVDIEDTAEEEQQVEANCDIDELQNPIGPHECSNDDECM